MTLYPFADIDLARRLERTEAQGSGSVMLRCWRERVHENKMGPRINTDKNKPVSSVFIRG